MLVGQAYGCDTDFIISYIAFPAIRILELLILVQAAPLIGLGGGSFEVKIPPWAAPLCLTLPIWKLELLKSVEMSTILIWKLELLISVELRSTLPI